jgi:hypothetical protein
MKHTTIQLLIGLTCLTLPGAASTIQVLSSDAEFGLTDNVGYTLKTVGNNSIGNQTTFTPASGQTNLVTTTGVQYASYLSLLPGGSTLTGATLDFAGLFSVQSYGASLTGGTFFYQPTFSSLLSAYTVTVSSTIANVTLAGPSSVGYDLWPLFANDILAGHAISVKWSAVDTFSADNSTYGNNCKNCTEQFQVTDTANFTASNTANALHLTFTAGSVSAPEPATLGMAGLVLAGLGFVKRRKRC